MNNYQAFYLKIFGIYFTYNFILIFTIMLFWNYYDYTTKEYYSRELFNSMLLLDFYLALIFGGVVSITVIIRYDHTFKRIQAGLDDTKWRYVEYGNAEYELQGKQVYDKCMSCIKRLNWHILGEIVIGSQPTINRLVGATNIGYIYYPGIFLIDISEFGPDHTSLHCSIRSYSLSNIVGKRIRKKQIDSLIKCLSEVN